MRRLSRFDDRGSATVEAVLVIPVLMLLLLVAVQFALWSHASQVVHTAASEGDAMARSYGGGSQQGAARAQEVLRASQSNVIGPTVRVNVLSGDEVKVTVTARAISILPGIQLPVSATETGTIQKFRANE
jgi:Flp pilus assembly protein TadG